MSTIQDLQNRRDIHAARCAELEQALDDLSGLETIADVQKLTDELGAARRLLAALDRQVLLAEQAQHEQARAEREQRRLVVAKEAAVIDGDVRRLMLQIWDLVDKREDVTTEFPEQATVSARMRTLAVDMLRFAGVQFQTNGLGRGISPVRR